MNTLTGRKRAHGEQISSQHGVVGPSVDHSFDLIMRNAELESPPNTTSSKRSITTDFLKPLNLPSFTPSNDVKLHAPVDICGYNAKSRTLSSEQLSVCLKERELVQLDELAERSRHARRFKKTHNALAQDFVVVGILCHIWRMESPDSATGTQMATKSSSDTKSAVSGDNDPRSGSMAKADDKKASLGQVGNQDTGANGIWICRMTDLGRTSVCFAIRAPLQPHVTVKYGDIVALLNPSYVFAVDGEGVVLEVARKEQVCVLGVSQDIGVCAFREPSSVPPSATSNQLALSRTPLPQLTVPSSSMSAPSSEAPIKPNNAESRGKRVKADHPLPISQQPICSNFVNTARSEFCEYHMYLMFLDSKGNRMVLNDPGGGSLSSSALRREISETTLHLSEGIFPFGPHKWKISHRTVKLVPPSSFTAVSPSETQLCVPASSAESPL